MRWLNRNRIPLIFAFFAAVLVAMIFARTPRKDLSAAVAELKGWGSWASADVASFAMLYGFRFAKAHDRRQWANQKLTEKRLQLFDELMPQLNDLMCYFKEVGRWKEFEPPALIESKRNLDKAIYVNEPLFSNEFRQGYFAYVNACFKPYVGERMDAQLRMPGKTKLKSWNPAWQDYFCPKATDHTSPEFVQQ